METEGVIILRFRLSKNFQQIKALLFLFSLPSLQT